MMTETPAQPSPVTDQRFRYWRSGRKLLEGSAQVLDDLFGDEVGRGESGGVFHALVAQPEDVQARLIPLDQVVGAEAAEALGLLALAAVVGGGARHEVIQMRTRQRIGLEGEAPVGAQAASILRTARNDHYLVSE